MAEVSPSVASRAVSNFKIVNLQDVNDSAAGRMEGLEVRMARNDLESRDVGVSLFRYALGRAQSRLASSTASRRRRT